jgi:hypothetical protein
VYELDVSVGFEVTVAGVSNEVEEAVELSTEVIGDAEELDGKVVVGTVVVIEEAVPELSDVLVVEAIVDPEDVPISVEFGVDVADAEVRTLDDNDAEVEIVPERVPDVSVAFAEDPDEMTDVEDAVGTVTTPVPELVTEAVATDVLLLVADTIEDV